jgi:oxygen-dependent protoporphyrinogen oxidase
LKAVLILSTVKEFMKKVAVIGAGLSGLSAAHFVRKKYPNAEITLFERSDRIGGNIRSERHGEFLLEFGPSAINATNKTLLSLLDELALSNNCIASGSSSRQHYIYKHPNLVPLPQNYFDFLRSSLVPSPLSTVLNERKVAPMDIYDSTKTFAFRHFGRDVASGYVEPLLRRKSFGDVSKLSTNAMLSDLKNIERESGSLFRSNKFSLFKTELINKDFNSEYSFENGLESLCHTLVKHNNLTILFNQQVKAVTQAKDGKVELSVADASYKFDHAFVTTPSHVSAHLLRKCDEEFYKALGLIKYAPVAVVNLVYDHSCIKIDANGYSIAGLDRDHVVHVRFPSKQFAAHSKKNHDIITVYLGGTTNPKLLEKPAHQIVKHALSHLRKTMQIKSDPVLVKIRQYSRGIPQYTMGVEKVWARLDAAKAKYSHISLLGNYQYGTEMEDAVSLAKETVDSL